jgi:hypothetical protein
MRASRSLGTFGGVRGIAAVLAALVSLQACSQRASAEASQNRMTAVQEKMERVRHLAPEWVQSGGEAHLIQARMQEVHQLLE